jgi:hypothetical protein
MTLFEQGDRDQLAKTLDILTDHYLLESQCQTRNWNIAGISELCQFLNQADHPIFDSPATSRALFHFIRCLCLVSNPLIDHLLASGFFDNLVRPAVEGAIPHLSGDALGITRQVWLFQLQISRVTRSELFSIVWNLPLVSHDYALQLMYVIRDLVSRRECRECELSDVFNFLVRCFQNSNPMTSSRP